MLDPLAVPTDELLGVFLDTTFGSVAVAEVDPDDGTFEIPAVLAGNYELSVRYANPDDWSPVSDPLVLLVDGDLQQFVAISLSADEVLALSIVVDITT